MDREVLVIIGSGGMGIAVARRLGAGRVVLLADVNPDLLSRAAEGLADDGHTVLTRQVDVTSKASVDELAEYAVSSGPVTALVHTAGVSPEQASTEVVLAVDLLGVALVLEAFGQVIESRGAGVVIASMAGYFIPPFEPAVESQLATAPADTLLSLECCAPERIGSSQMAYPFAKRANQLRVAAAASAWGKRGARINSISPGVISTAMGRQELAGDSGAFMRAMVDASGTRRVGTPDDIAAAVEFLLSRGASFITGIDLPVDGGVIAAMRNGQVKL
jgi:NAD(P)-dependent dehydrogenase (short-subunit alcohol dehydrogenase family)